jgi:Ala-tRNA(Pro) deacylase
MALTPDTLLARLDEHGIKTTTVQHPPLYTVEESQKLRGEIAGGHTKNLFLKDKKGKLWLVVAEEDASIDMKRLHERIGSARLSFGKADLLMAVLGVPPGSVTPFALVNDTEKLVTLVIDEPLLAHAVLNFHPLTNEATTSIARDDFLVFMRTCGHEPTILRVSGEA